MLDQTRGDGVRRTEGPCVGDSTGPAGRGAQTDSLQRLTGMVNSVPGLVKRSSPRVLRARRLVVSGGVDRNPRGVEGG